MKKLLRGYLSFKKPIYIQVLANKISKRVYLTDRIYKVTAIRGNKDLLRACVFSCTAKSLTRCRECKGYFLVAKDINNNNSGSFAAIDYKVLSPEELGVKLL